MTKEEAAKELEEEFKIFLEGSGLDNEEHLEKEMKSNEELRKVVEANRMAISTLSGDIRPNIHGHWIHDNNPFKDIWFCSNCKPFKKAVTKKTDFCPDCGADMREPKGEKAENV